ncbi:MAG TPA: FkbM family methyltransferase [Dongiaceae bacterium]|nr:FkbM family methyltransferase [Dongiaceae bacterium]
MGLKPATREYSYDIISCPLPREGEIFYAQWRHPKESKKQLTQASVDAARKFLKEGDVAIDIGAHTGDSTVPLALAVGPAGAVFALEPNPFVFKILLANSSLNKKKTNIHPLMFAATPRDGQFEFEYSDPGFCNGGLHQNVRRRRHAHFFKLQITGKNLTDYLKREFPDELKRLRLIKIDTEGFDPEVFASLKEIVAQYKPFIRSEIYRHLPEEQRRGYFDDLAAMGYRIHKFGGDENYQGGELTSSDMMNWEHFDIFAVPKNHL